MLKRLFYEIPDCELVKSLFSRLQWFLRSSVEILKQDGASATIRKCLPRSGWRNSRESKCFFSAKFSFFNVFGFCSAWMIIFLPEKGGFPLDGKRAWKIYYSFDGCVGNVWRCLKYSNCSPEIQNTYCTPKFPAKELQFEIHDVWYPCQFFRQYTILWHWYLEVRLTFQHVQMNWSLSILFEPRTPTDLSTNSSSDSLYMLCMWGWTPQEDSFCMFSFRNP